MTTELMAPTAFDPKNWGERVDIGTISRIRVPVQGPDTWRPLPHDVYVHMIEKAFTEQGFTISEPIHYMAKARSNQKIKDLPEHGRFLSTYGIMHPLLPGLDDLRWEAAFKNSYDMTMSATGSAGYRVKVCSNGLDMGAEQGFRRKHTKGIDVDRDGVFEHIQRLVTGSIGNIITQAVSEEKLIDTYKNTECSNADARFVAIESAKQGVIGGAAILRIMDHWDSPEHPEFKDRNVWSLQNAFTSNDRGQNLMTQADRFASLRSIISNRFGFTAQVVPDSMDEDYVDTSFGDPPISASDW